MAHPQSTLIEPGQAGAGAGEKRDFGVWLVGAADQPHPKPHSVKLLCEKRGRSARPVPGRLEACANLLDGGIRQAEDGPAREAGGVVHFHFDHHPVQPDDCTGINAR